MICIFESWVCLPMKAWKFSTVFPLHNDRSKVEGVANRWCRRRKTRVSGHGYAYASCTFGVVGPFGLKLLTDLRSVSATFGHLVKLAIGGHMFGSSSCRVWNLVWWVWIFMHSHGWLQDLSLLCNHDVCVGGRGLARDQQDLSHGKLLFHRSVPQGLTCAEMSVLDFFYSSLR